MAAKILKSEKGMATLEALPLLVIFIMLVSYGLGMFGIIHTGILHSIASRTYAFETFRNRTNLTYFRDNKINPGAQGHYNKYGVRFHAVKAEDAEGERFTPSKRTIAIGKAVERLPGSAEIHNNSINELQVRNQKVEVNPAWIMVGYGICINATCGGGQP